jgi:hypothetical protein
LTTPVWIKQHTHTYCTISQTYFDNTWLNQTTYTYILYNKSKCMCMLFDSVRCCQSTFDLLYNMYVYVVWFRQVLSKYFDNTLLDQTTYTYILYNCTISQTYFDNTLLDQTTYTYILYNKSNLLWQHLCCQSRFDLLYNMYVYVVWSSQVFSK